MAPLRALLLLLPLYCASAAVTPQKRQDGSCTLTADPSGDDAAQFREAGQSCSVVTIPQDMTLNIATMLDMTGMSDTHISLEGTIRFEPDIDYWIANAHRFDFQNQSTFWLLGGENILLDGGGTIDGAGQAWYDRLPSNSTLQRPISLTIYQATNVVVKDIAMINGPNWFNLINESRNVTYSNITIHTESTSDNDPKNTDGWDTYRSDLVFIKDSVIVNGDDCVSFKPNSTNILVANLDCTGSHGISVGSLGQYPEFYDIVENVTAIDIHMTDASNGARIKAWAGPNVGSGIVRNVTFKNFVVDNVENPLTIDQCYFTDADACSANPSNTYMEDIYFDGFSGTSSGSTVATLKCSPDGRCSGINVNNLGLSPKNGGTPNGDDAAQFREAGHSCSVVTIPQNTTLNIATMLDMTGLSDTHISLEGTIRFKPDIGYWLANAHQIEFQNQSTFWLLGGKNIVLNGGGTIDGAGQAWYDRLASNSTLQRPISLTIFQGTNVVIEDITMINSPEWFNLVNESRNVTYSNITIHTESTSGNPPRNTDGWDTYRSDNVVIKDSMIVNDDDCVSFKPNSTNIFVSNLNSTGSHGISVGSLGQYPQYYDIVENVTVINIYIADAQNGARIKAWAGANVGSGIVRNITFTNFVLENVQNPVIIDQCYKTDADACAANPSNTFIEDIYFDGISGTSSNETVASLKCSPGGRCSNINVNNFELSPKSGGKPKFVCQNVKLTGNAAGLFPECTGK
uniref:galacturonan 1,4-alpha-galacturonidase n=1 Tax=Moniliophthora roreri TaxID=221103 RepID=A0A0W0FB86_MONRR